MNSPLILAGWIGDGVEAGLVSRRMAETASNLRGGCDYLPRFPDCHANTSRNCNREEPG